MDLEKEVPSLLQGDEGEFREEEILAFDENDEPLDVESQLEQFRQQWQAELKGSQANMSNQGLSEKDEVEKEAAALFLMGSKLEQEGSLYEAVNFYRRAMQLVPDIEMRIEYPRSPRERFESESSVDSYDGEELESDLLSRFHNLKVEEKRICSPAYQQRACHISALPVEVLIYIFKWVVSSQLDMKSLESIAEVCRGFYLCARDEELWRLACLRVWGSNTGKVKKYGLWRNMYIERPHLQFVGCYISKMSYIRQGEKSLDGFYSPWHSIEYFRYIRFFSEGKVLMMTSPEHPSLTLPKFKYSHAKTPGMLKGAYKISGNRVTGVLKRVPNTENASNYKYKRNKNIQNDVQQSFHIELEIQNVGKRNGCKLSWIHYSVKTFYKSTGEDNDTDFELSDRAYPPLIFSRVKSFSADLDSCLQP
ncbi:F-box only protein 9-like [Ruditapes philippinarum]|uniref:F-box only protein 9-like n=1 Tax=Ruditapes philippinarum TaxID=129788 RepID=UPI00295C1D60|nr:F-box only protein 9-like [Ruditapes philippinarum]